MLTEKAVMLKLLGITAKSSRAIEAVDRYTKETEYSLLLQRPIAVGEINLLSGTAGTGKTLFLLFEALSLAEKYHKVLFVSNFPEQLEHIIHRIIESNKFNLPLVKANFNICKPEKYKNIIHEVTRKKYNILLLDELDIILEELMPSRPDDFEMNVGYHAKRMQEFMRQLQLYTANNNLITYASISTREQFTIHGGSNSVLPIGLAFTSTSIISIKKDKGTKKEKDRSVDPSEYESLMFDKDFLVDFV